MKFGPLFLLVGMTAAACNQTPTAPSVSAATDGSAAIGNVASAEPATLTSRTEAATISRTPVPPAVTVGGPNRIEGMVTYNNAGRYGVAPGAAIEVVNTSTRAVVFRTSADGQGRYTAAALGGTLQVRATFVDRGRTLTGLSNGVYFDVRSVKQVKGVNILVR